MKTKALVTLLLTIISHMSLGDDSDPIIGLWKWDNSKQDFFACPDGTAIQAGRIGKWVCLKPAASPREYRMDWDGGRAVDMVSLLKSGTELSGRNQFNGPLLATRIPYEINRDPLVGLWKWDHNQALFFLHPDGTGVGPKRQATWKCLNPNSRPLTYELNWDKGAFIDTLTLSAEGTKLAGQNQTGGKLNATRVLPLLSGPTRVMPIGVPAQLPPPVATPKTYRTPSGNDKEIAVNPDWMPKRERTSKEYGQGLAFFSLAALSGEEPGNETVPENLIFGLKWLMPLQQAEALLKPALEGSQLGSPVMIQNQNFPHRSFYLRSYFGKFQPDPQNGEVFKQAHLLLDAKMRLISVELTANRAIATDRLVPPQIRVPGWTERGMILPKDISEDEAAKLAGGTRLPESGVRNPYFDYLTSKANAAGGRGVFYQIMRDSSKKGVTTIHISLGAPSGAVSENVRWYLPAPLARVLLDIAVKNELGAVPAK